LYENILIVQKNVFKWRMKDVELSPEEILQFVKFGIDLEQELHGEDGFEYSW